MVSTANCSDPSFRGRSGRSSRSHGLAQTQLPLTLALSNETEAGESNASKVQWFDRYRDSVNGCGVGQDCLDVAQVHTDRNGPGALGRTLFAKLY